MTARLAFWLCLLAVPAAAETSAEAIARKPDLFHPETGYRIDRHRAPTPEDVPGGVLVSADELGTLSDAVLIDVYGAAQSRFDELDGTWLVSEPRLSLPGAVWLPEIGRGVLDETMRAYMADNLAALTARERVRTLVFFCVADCWMSWNAVQRASALGYRDVRWFRDGTDGWLDAGFELVPVDPVPVTLD